MGQIFARQACDLWVAAVPFALLLSRNTGSVMIRTRFSPSPTGMLHIGSARVALYCWLFARRHQGDYILRIEDTDRERSTQEAVDVILDGLAWLGIDHDTGPIFQSQRDSLYTTYLQKLLDTNQAYYCNCSKQRLDDLRAEQMANKQKPKYDHHCRDLQLPPGDDTVVRFANPTEGVVSFDDAVLGNVTIANAELDDFIIARSDGSPTYNFTVVVDDVEMKISHVIRGNDHVNNTPRQINMMRALGATPPTYAHLPLILGDDGAKLSKRHGALSVLEYQKQGYLPHALLNYLLRLGWSHGDDELFSQAEMIQLFDLEHVNKSPARFDTKKSLWINQHYIKHSSPEDLQPAVELLAQQMNVDYNNGPELTAVIAAFQDRAKTVVELVEKSAFFYTDITGYDEKAMAKHVNEDTRPIVERVYEKLSSLDDWQEEKIQALLTAIVDESGLKFGKVAQPIRLALTGGTVSPSLGVTLQLFGREKALSRLQDFILLIGGEISG